jgi:membrane protease subunit (stomatin/prohibitin family)
MALIDVVQYEAQDDSFFVWKYPGNQLKLGSQLIVGEGQKAVFVKGGQALDVLETGTHTLTTGNIPLLDKLINLPFGGDTPFSAEVWFVNTTVKRNLRWGTPNPIQLMDASLGFPVSVRSFGKWGVRIFDVRSFISQIVGTLAGADADKVSDYFIGEIIQSLSATLSGVIARGEASVFQITALVTELSQSASGLISAELDKFGVELINFNIESINIPAEEMVRIQDVFNKTLEARELSKVEVGGAFTAIKSFDVLQSAAENESDNGLGAMLGAGIGVGAGLNLGQKMGNQLEIQPSADSTGSSESEPLKKLKQLKQMLDDGLIEQEQFDAKRDQILGEL